MKIIITAAGLGNRFYNIGINKPKYKIIAKNKSLFYWSINSLKNFFQYEFIFIFRKEIYDKEFIEKKIKELGIKKYYTVLINDLTDGQASTAMFADNFVKEEEEVMIYNVDTFVNPDSMDNKIMEYDGSIVVANASGEHWSFAKLGDNGFVSQVSEKVKISNYASIGPYYFNKWKDFKWVFNNFKDDIKKQYKEVYICPMYQYLIDIGKKIKIFQIKENDFICLGTPQEISNFDQNWLEKNQYK